MILMRQLFRFRLWRFTSPAVFSLLALGLATVSPAAFAIEMFTYFGDGSRIGLPSLEVPIQAYPGIPLRSDRIRARRRSMQALPGQAIPNGPAGVTIRAMPQAQQAARPR